MRTFAAFFLWTSQISFAARKTRPRSSMIASFVAGIYFQRRPPGAFETDSTIHCHTFLSAGAFVIEPQRLSGTSRPPGNKKSSPGPNPTSFSFSRSSSPWWNARQCKSTRKRKKNQLPATHRDPAGDPSPLPPCRGCNREQGRIYPAKPTVDAIFP